MRNMLMLWLMYECELDMPPDFTNDLLYELSGLFALLDEVEQARPAG